MYLGLSEAADLLKEWRDAVIIVHQNPDGDCIGAGFALKDILGCFGIRSRVECCDAFPPRYDYMTAVGCGEDFEPQTVIAVDIADTQLMGSLAEKYGDRVKLCIDHHISNTGYAEMTVLSAQASATCEIIWDLALEMGAEISDHCAACIYTGIATDTGCFKYDCTTAHCHRIAAQIIEDYDIGFAKINRSMFEVKSAGRIKMECRVIELMEYYLDNKITMICITKEIMDQMGVDSNDLEGCASLPLQVEGVEVGLMIKEREPQVYKISMRSAGDVNVSDICRTLGGGGHAKAAGCLLKGSIDEVKSILIDTVGKAVCR